MIQLSFLLQMGNNPMMVNLAFMTLMFAIAYFFLLRPQRQKQKQQDEFVNELKKGDEVVTTGGIVGKINKLEDNEVTIQTSEKSFIRVLRSSISKDMSEALAGAGVEK